MYIYVYIYIYTHVCVCISLSLYIYIYIYMHKGVSISKFNVNMHEALCKNEFLNMHLHISVACAMRCPWIDGRSCQLHTIICRRGPAQGEPPGALCLYHRPVDWMSICIPLLEIWRIHAYTYHACLCALHFPGDWRAIPPNSLTIICRPRAGTEWASRCDALCRTPYRSMSICI